jgi:DNA-binding Lrp family transcriptional regulator
VSELEKDFTLIEVAEALGMSERWLRQRIKEGAVHNRYGHKIRFTREQVDALKASFTKEPIEQSITTGKKRAS